MRYYDGMTTETYTVRSSATKDVERVSASGDGRSYGQSIIQVLDADGREVSYYSRRRGFGGASTEARIDGRTYFSVPVEDRPRFRTLRAWYLDAIRTRFGVEVSR